MRFSLIILMSLISYTVAGQKVELRNDSLLINNFLVTKNTGKSTLDDVLKSEGKEHRRTGKYKEQITSITYRKLGLIFNRLNSDTSVISLAIKLFRNSDLKVDNSNMATSTFKGDLYIAGNYMNDKKTLEQLQKLENCTFSYKRATPKFNGNTVYLTQGYINYNNHSISLLFDSKTNTVTCVFIR